MTEKDTSVGME